MRESRRPRSIPAPRHIPRHRATGTPPAAPRMQTAPTAGERPAALAPAHTRTPSGGYLVQKITPRRRPALSLYGRLLSIVFRMYTFYEKVYSRHHPHGINQKKERHKTPPETPRQCARAAAPVNTAPAPPAAPQSHRNAASRPRMQTAPTGDNARQMPDTPPPGCRTQGRPPRRDHSRENHYQPIPGAVEKPPQPTPPQGINRRETPLFIRWTPKAPRTAGTGA
jgi:hypothetical protein